MVSHSTTYLISFPPTHSSILQPQWPPCCPIKIITFLPLVFVFSYVPFHFSIKIPLQIKPSIPWITLPTALFSKILGLASPGARIQLCILYNIQKLPDREISWTLSTSQVMQGSPWTARIATSQS